MKATVDKKDRRTAMVPITTMEEVWIPSDEERAEMLASLKSAEEGITAGEHVEHDAETFIDRMMGVREAAIRNKKA